MTISETAKRCAEILDEVERVIVGKREVLRLVLLGILADGHVLLEDLPGLGKTMMARSFAHVLGLQFTRIQFTPDLLPADVTGSFLYDQRNHDFAFRPGPIFTNLLLADEINRTPPKTQSALLEAMQEKQVSVEGTTFELEPPFHVLATANPIEYEGTYPLPEAQLDRFLMRVSFGYPSTDQEYDVVQRRLARQQEEVDLKQVSVEGTTYVLEAPFHVLATANPIEYEGTYPLPEAQLDRFLLRLGVGYPTREQEWEVLERRLAHRSDEVSLEPRASAEDLLAMRQAIERVHVDPSVGRYIVDVVTATRESTRVQVGASPRGSLAVLKLTRSRAALQRRDFVVPEDVKAVAVPALAHRITLRPELWVQRVRGEEVIQECLDSVATPRAD